MLEIVINSNLDIEDNIGIHKHIIDTFKSEISDVYLKNFYLKNLLIMEFEYNPELKKFKIKSIPEFYKANFDRLLVLNPKLKKHYFL